MKAPVARFLTPDRILGIVLLILCSVLWFVVVPEFVRGQDQSFFPRFAIGWIAFFAAALMLVPAARSAPERARPGDPADAAPPAATEEPDADVTIVTSDDPLPSVFVVAIIWGAYAASLSILGFYLATWLMLVVSMAYLGIRRPRALLIRPLLVLVVVHVLLERLLNFRLPLGFWQ